MYIFINVCLYFNFSKPKLQSLINVSFTKIKYSKETVRLHNTEYFMNIH